MGITARRVTLRRLLIAVSAALFLLVVYLFLIWHHRGTFQARVDSHLLPRQATAAAAGVPQTVAASRDDKGIQTDFLEAIVLLKPRNDADLQAFLVRYHGTIVGDDALPQLPADFGITLTPEQRKPLHFKIRLALTDEHLRAVAANSAAAGLTGALRFSSRAGLQTFATVIAAAAAGFHVSGDFISHADQAFPVTLLQTQERAKPPAAGGGFDDAFTDPAYADFGSSGNASNVLLAWQFIAAHGIQRRTRVAILDNGFYLDGNGLARGSDSDFPGPTKPLQYDIDFGDDFAGDAGDGQCGGNPCYWHGTGSTGSTIGVANNQRGGAGPGGFIADPILIRINSSFDERNKGVRLAAAMGADVISMSFGTDCDVWCRMQDRADNPFDDAAASPSKPVLVASAGNGQGKPAAGYDVGEPSFYHPCIEDHVICVGALTPKSTTIASYSNFGAQVQIFAPSGIKVMSFPPSADAAGNSLPLAQADGPPVPQVFFGTSASAPFVAGIVAMIKAVNPSLGHDQVAAILRATAHPGSGPVTRTIDAYAAVRQAAGVTPIVDDALERNDLDTHPSDLGILPSYSRNNLNIDNRDRDFFLFNSPRGSVMSLTLVHPRVLGTVGVLAFDVPTGICQAPTLVSNTPNPIVNPVGGSTVVYRVPGGPLRLGLNATDVNAYNMAINFATDTYAPDVFEPNDTPATARFLSSIRRAGIGKIFYDTIDPRVTIDATLHTASDVDFYIIHAATLTLAERIFVASFASVQIYGNDSLVNVDVFRLNPDNTPGASVAHVSGVRCAPVPVEVRLDEGAYYLVKVTGDAGRYTLRNSIGGSPPHIAQLEHDQVYFVLHPGEPIEQVIRFPEISVFTHQREFTAVQLSGQGTHANLFDSTGARIAESVVGQQGETLSLAAAVPGSVYFLELTPKNLPATLPTALSWVAAPPQRSSDNLILNPGAELGQQSPNGDVPGWQRIDGLPAPRAATYSNDGTSASPTGPGSKERGTRLFLSGGVSGQLAPGKPARGNAQGNQGNPISGLQQTIALDDDWKRAIQQGTVTAHLAGFLGGSLNTPRLATVMVTFLASQNHLISQLALPAVGPREREGKSGLFPVDIAERVPEGTETLRVALIFTGQDRNRDAQAYADNLQLILTKN
jgi:Subtilase family